MNEVATPARPVRKGNVGPSRNFRLTSGGKRREEAAQVCARSGVDGGGEGPALVRSGSFCEADEPYSGVA